MKFRSTKVWPQYELEPHEVRAVAMEAGCFEHDVLAFGATINEMPYDRPNPKDEQVRICRALEKLKLDDIMRGNTFYDWRETSGHGKPEE